MTGKVPWASGPSEILEHGLDLLTRDSDINRRLALLSIDNSVELMVRTYLGLPKRITGLAISRKRFSEISNSFSALLDELEQNCAEKLRGIDLGTIEWYHRLRNQLYHDGNGLTIERDKVEIYAELAHLLYEKLFERRLPMRPRQHKELLGEFLATWVALEEGLRDTADRNSAVGFRPGPFKEVLRFIRGMGFLEASQMAELGHLRDLRNEIVHGKIDYRDEITPQVLGRLTEFAQMFNERED
jgi:hypothetical protein